MNRKLLMTFLLLPVTLLINAQSNYKEGTVVENNGDSIKGFINYREWHRNPDNILFKKAIKNTEAHFFTVDSIAGFTITGYESYARFRVQISMDEINFQRLKEYFDSTRITKSVFLKLVSKGDRIDLYSYSDELKARFYILDKRLPIPYELIYQKSINNGQELTQSLYKQQLSELAVHYGVSNASLEEDISKANYSGKDIRNIIGKINTQNEASQSMVIDKKRKFDFFLGTGITGSKMVYTGESLIMMDGLDDMGKYNYKDKIITHSYLPRLSGGVDFYINPAIQRFIIRVEASASKINSTVNSYYKFNIYSGNETDNTYRFSAWNISLSPQLIFNLYNTNNFKWHIGGGFSLNYLAVTDNSMERRDHQTGSFIDKTEDYLSINGFAMNAIIQSGILLNKRFDFSLIWTSPSEYTNYIVGGQFIKTTLVSFAASYYFKN